MLVLLFWCPQLATKSRLSVDETDFLISNTATERKVCPGGPIMSLLGLSASAVAGG